ncbi:type III-A CRISPR-associated RAMP protein Csm4 [Methanobrevibacter filiformis]|uniref:CRISPR system Cms protein Csm4 n=1 Tax=Methanobrevibacter filiformis TaxID=55758 RepID=A0A166FFK8_9EURY|nr:type III-A CRISPR-associated RAMP protein Csm4 [Methanobrevibacter filiformis]KZX17624.1 hypothetical protein MBFIL_00340 [Methanobrevibacter filiformis]
MIIYIKPNSTLPHLSSDKIFGSIIYGISQLFPEKVDKIVNLFNGEIPPFIVSSAFPFVEHEGRKLKFYPKPMLRSNDFEKLDKSMDIAKEIDKIKKIKKFAEIEFVDETIFNQLINNKTSDLEIFDSLGIDYFIIADKFLMNTENKNVFESSIKVHSTEIRPQNSINRLLNSTQFFYSEGNRFAGNNGVFFLIKFNEDFKNIVLSSLKFLQDRGLGHDISSGRGHFNFTHSNEELVTNNKGQYFTILSRFIPDNNDIQNLSEKSNYSFYDTGVKQGRKTSGLFKQKIRFFKEGSVFPIYDKFYGTTVQQNNDSEDKYVEYGIPFTVRCIGSD